MYIIIIIIIVIIIIIIIILIGEQSQSIALTCSFLFWMNVYVSFG